MKKLLLILLCLPMIGFGQWQYLGNSQFVSTNEGYGYSQTDIESKNGKTYVTFIHEDSHVLSVMKLINEVWTSVGSPIISEAGDDFPIELKVSTSDIPYVAFQSYAEEVIKVMFFDNNTWINLFNGEGLFSFDLSSDDMPYITTWDEDASQLITRKYDGGVWENIGNPIQCIECEFRLTISEDNTPYMAVSEWDDNNSDGVKVYFLENNSWTSITSLEKPNGYCNLYEASSFKIGPNNTPYLTVYKEQDAGGDVHVYRYTNQAWEYIQSPFTVEAGEEGFISINITEENIPYVLYNDELCDDDSWPNSLIMKRYINSQWVDVGLNCFGDGGAETFAMDDYGIYVIENSATNGNDYLTAMWFPLNTNEIATTQRNPNRKLDKTIDMLGREVNPQPNTPLIEVYDDGTVEKKIIIE